jgi:hypothetical protein
MCPTAICPKSIQHVNSNEDAISEAELSNQKFTMNREVFRSARSSDDGRASRKVGQHAC